MIITLTGFMGSGKSTVGRCLANELNAAFLDLDELVMRSYARQQGQACSISEIFDLHGEVFFRELEHQILAETIDQHCGQTLVLALGGGTFIPERNRSLLLARTHCVYLRCSLATIKQRVGESNDRPLFANSDLLYSQREPIYALAHKIIDVDELTPLQVALSIL